MRKSNFFFKKSFSFGGKFSPHFRKRFVTFNIIVLLVLASVSASENVIWVNASNLDSVSADSVSIVSPEVPSDLVIELRSLNASLDYIVTMSEANLDEVRNLNDNLETLLGVVSHIFGALFLVIIVITFVVVFRLLYKFFVY